MNIINLSIVVPIYNVQKYLVECLDSLVAGISLLSSSNEIEVILVNDGSTDDSERICQEYCDKYRYMKYIYQENKGLSGARNTGIRAAKGTYLLFVDSDDFINSELLPKLVTVAKENYDLVFLTAIKYFANGELQDFGEIYLEEDIVGKTKSEVLANLVNRFTKYPGSAWNKLIRRQLVIDNHLFFEEGIYSEDLEWSIRLFNVAQTFSLVEGIYYYYRQGRADSITGSFSKKNLDSLYYILNKYKDIPFPKKIESSLFSFLSYEYIVLLYLANKLKLSDRVYLNNIYSMRNILLKSHKNKYKLIYLFVSLFGVKFSAYLISSLKEKAKK